MAETAWVKFRLGVQELVRHRVGPAESRDLKTGKRRALCGTLLDGPYRGEEFDPSGPHACRECCRIGGVA